MSELVTIVTVAHNAGRYIETTLESVAEQTYGPLEHLVFDACSDDGTQEILARYEDRYDLRWVSEPDRGQSHAFNKGIAASRGGWLYFLNADDRLLDAGAIERVMAWIDGHPGHGIYMGRIRGLDEDGNDLGEGAPVIFPLYTRDVLVDEAAIVVHQATFYRREVFESVGMYSEEYRTHMDYEFHLRASGRYPIAAMDVTVAYLRTHPEAKSMQADTRRYRELFRARRRSGGRLWHPHNLFYLKGYLNSARWSRPVLERLRDRPVVRALTRRSGWHDVSMRSGRLKDGNEGGRRT